MTAARPVLFIGPSQSHIGDLLAQHDIGIHLQHGDTDAAVAAIRTLRSCSPQRRADMGAAAHRAMEQTFSQSLLCGRLCDAVENALRL
jgi:hypothetical protein